VLIIILLALVATYASFHHQIQRSLTVGLLLDSKNPREESFEYTANQVSDPVDFLRRAWATGKITHRQLVAEFLKSNAVRNSSWLSGAEPLVVACTMDADASVRELGLATLEARHSPRLFEAAQAQLEDIDPLIRLLGLNYLRPSDPKKAVPILIRFLNDPDLRIVAAAEVGLMRATGEDYGVRARLAIASQEGNAAGKVDPANVEAIRRGVEQRKEWWLKHQNDYELPPGSPASLPELRLPDIGRPPAADFTLRDLQGNKVSLSNFKGRVVLLNFWATWCTACLAEIPDLVALQQTLGTKVVILGVALDGVPDEDGDNHGERDEKSTQANSSPSSVRAKVQHAVKARRINYQVLLDPKNSVGAQFNGGELPTTVILDSEGRVRRRFIGERNLAVFQAMVAEAAKPLTTGQTRAEPLVLESSENRVVLLELFTSEGCSSCPPAEKWFSGLKGAPGLWKEFVPLAFHVDYWNYLGWRDPWASKANSDRQRGYAAHWGGNSIYTPGFVLNGEEWRAWSPRKDAPQVSRTRVGVLKTSSQDLEHWLVNFSPARQDTAGFEAHVAILANGLESEVKAGENRGRRLNHDFVVTSLTTRPLKKYGDQFQAEIELKAEQKKGLAVASWVTRLGDLEPLQAIGGWIPN
jgi:thiol-disulfide isomerase/thioredoxin